MGFLRISSDNKRFLQNSSKSLLSTKNTESISCEVVYTESPFLETTLSTGFTHNDKPVISPLPPLFILNPSHIIKEDSIIDSVDTGFGKNNTISQNCPKPEYNTPLYKENYLGDFKEETEKIKVRNNLDVYSKNDINKIISEIIANDTGTFITKLEVEKMLKDLDFVNSDPRAKVSYDIPNNLFKL